MQRFDELPEEMLKRIVAQADRTCAQGLLLANRALSKLALEREWRVERIPCAFERLVQRFPRTVVDRNIDRFVNATLTKPMWQAKCRDEAIITRWMEESGMTRRQVDYAVDECFYLRDLVPDASLIPSPISGVWYKDNVTIDLNAVIPMFEDWQPETNERVLNIIHPSLFPIVHGVTQDSEGRVLTSEESKFQWLPAEVAVSNGRTTVMSYINNLPDKEHYDLIARAFDVFVPLFNCVLTDYLYPLDVAIHHERFVDHEQWDPDHAWGRLYREGTDLDNGVILFKDVEPEGFAPPRPRGRVDLSNSDLQVIVKMANVLLTPEKPKFDLGKWHIEGTRAENIVASGIYYYDSSNIAGDTLELRMAWEGDDMGLPTNSHREVAHIFGIRTESGVSSQLLGRVATLQGRCLAFPNNLQHRVADFELEDKTRGGHRKLLAFFLVNPDERVPSSRDVPPQQGRMAKEQALEYRRQLMQERSSTAAETSREIFENYFSLCEH